MESSPFFLDIFFSEGKVNEEREENEMKKDNVEFYKLIYIGGAFNCWFPLFYILNIDCISISY